MSDEKSFAVCQEMLPLFRAVLIGKRFQHSVKSAKTYPEADTNSNHMQVICKLKIKLKVPIKPKLDAKLDMGVLWKEK